MKNQYKKYMLRKFLRFPIFAAIILPMFFLSNCSKGKVTIYGISDTVRNCSLPYVVEFFPDAEFGAGDVTFEWDFGDGTSSFEESPVHVYENTGLFQVTLTITNKEVSQSKTVSLDLQTESIPIIADWDYYANTNQLWVPSEVFFQNFSQHATSYFWDFGDGYYSTNQNPSHVYSQTGTYNVSLGAICEGDTVTYVKSLTILPPPSDIYIDEVLVWLPSEFLHSNLYCEIYYNSYSEAESTTAINVSSFPAIMSVGKDLFFFHGDFNDDVLTFEIWEQSNDYDPVYVFSIPLYRIQDQYYPNVWTWDNGSGYSSEVRVEFR